jgi:hypothetical protein
VGPMDVERARVGVVGAGLCVEDGIEVVGGQCVDCQKAWDSNIASVVTRFCHSHSDQPEKPTD